MEKTMDKKELFKKLMPKNEPVAKRTEVIPTDETDEKKAYREMLKNL